MPEGGMSFVVGLLAMTRFPIALLASPGWAGGERAKPTSAAPCGQAAIRPVDLQVSLSSSLLPSITINYQHHLLVQRQRSTS